MISTINHLVSTYDLPQFIKMSSDKNINWIQNMIDLKNSILVEEIKKNIVSIQNIPKFHDISEYPLIYMVIRHIYPKVRKQKYFNKIQNIDDFVQFVEWYHVNHTFISLDNLLNHIDHSHELYKIFNIMRHTNTPLKILYDVCYFNKFIGLDIIQEFESVDKIYYEINFEGTCLKIFFNRDQKDTEIMEIISKIIYIIKFIKSFVKKVSQKKKDHHLNVIILLSRGKKKQSLKNQILSPNNINSGMSMAGQIVYCWRNEEMQKVLIHELIHFYSLDFNESFHIYDKIMDPLTANMIKFEGVDSTNEAYTEFLAIVLNTIFVSHTVNEFIEKINIEFYYMLFQISKIIIHFHNNENNQKNLLDITIRQTTSVRSYYFLKSMLIFNLDKILEFFKKDDTPIKKITSYKKIMDYSYKKFTNDQMINLTISYMSEYLNKLDDDKWIGDNLRMSVYG